MVMENEYDPFDVGGPDYVPDTPGYQASKGTAASQLGYDSKSVYGDDGMGGGSDSPYAVNVNRGMGDGSGLSRDQFQTRYGITDRNPYGQTGFAKFFDRISKAIGGKGVDYRPQFAAIDRQMRRPLGTTQQQMMKRQYDLYRNPDIDESGRITSGGIDRLGRGTFQGPVEEINREMGTGEQLARGGIGALPVVGPMLSGAGGTDLYLSSRVTPEMRARENPSLAETFLGSVNSFKDSMASRLGSLASGKQPSSLPVQMDTSGARQPTADELVAATQAQAAAAPIAIKEANPQGPMMPAEFDRRLNDNTTAEMLREPSSPAPISEDIIESSFDDPLFNLPTPIGRRFDLPVTEIDTVTSRPMDEIDTVTSRPMDEIDMVTSRPMDEIDTISFQSLFPSEVLDSIASKPPELVNAPNEGLGRQGGLRFFAPEPELGPYEESQAPTRDLRDSTAVAGLDSSKITDALSSGILTDLLQGQLPSTSVPLGRGRLSVNPSLKEPSIEFRMPVEDLGIGEVLNFITGDAGTRDQGSFDVAEMVPASSLSDVLSSYGVYLPPGRTVDTDTLDVFNRRGELEGNIRALMRGKRDEGFSLPQLLSSYRTT